LYPTSRFETPEAFCAALAICSGFVVHFSTIRMASAVASPTYATRAEAFGLCAWEIGGERCGRQFVRQNPLQTVCPIHAIARRDEMQRQRKRREREKQK
jgi:hypothetical protein